MKLQKIHVRGFKSIYDDLVLDFNDIKGFWRINGSVGSGKTTIGEAIIFGLFGSIHGKNNGDLTSWGEKSTLVEVWCQSKGYQLYIKRDINRYGGSSIYVEVDGEELIYSNKRDAQRQLEDEYFDVSRITLELLCIISFNNFKSLATLNTYDTKQFLDQVFGFYILTNYTDKCRDKKLETTETLKNLQNKSFNLQSQIDKLTSLTNIKHIEGDIGEVRRLNDDLKKQLRSTVQESTHTRENYNKQISDITKKLGSIKSLGQNKAKEISFIEKGKCPTCGAPIDQSQLEIKKQERQLLLEQYNSTNEEVQRLTRERNEKDTLYEKEIHELNVKISDNNTLIAQLQAQESNIFLTTQEIDKIKQELSTINKQLDSTQLDLNQWNQLFDIISVDVRYKILNSFIPLINKSIREYTIQFQLPYIIEFDESFKCTIRIFGIDQDIPLSSLSTGQLKVVNISIILGILKTIMNSANFNICLLDELLSNMDIELRQVICRVLKENLRDDQTLFIITHTELEDKYFDGVIEANLEYRDDIHKRSRYTITHI